VWQEANLLARRAAQVCDRMPHAYLFFADQLRRASATVPFNIAEGNGARTRPQYLRYLGHARSSLNEVEAGVEYMRDTPIASRTDIDVLTLHVMRTGRLLAALIRSLGG